MQVRLEKIEKLTPDIWTFWFRPQQPLQYTAGQFIELSLPHANADQRGQRRWFTLSSSPSEELLAITTHLMAGGGSSYKQTLRNVPVGAVVAMSSPMGDFVLPLQKERPLVWVAGGLGITPMRSMARWLADQSERRTVELMYGAGHQADSIFLDIFAAAGVPVSQPARITSQAIMAAAKKMPDCLLYIAGPEPMTEQLVAELTAAGISGSRLVTDYFPGYE